MWVMESRKVESTCFDEHRCRSETVDCWSLSGAPAMAYYPTDSRPSTEKTRSSWVSSSRHSPLQLTQSSGCHMHHPCVETTCIPTHHRTRRMRRAKYVQYHTPSAWQQHTLTDTLLRNISKRFSRHSNLFSIFFQWYCNVYMWFIRPWLTFRLQWLIKIQKQTKTVQLNPTVNDVFSSYYIEFKLKFHSPNKLSSLNYRPILTSAAVN